MLVVIGMYRPLGSLFPAKLLFFAATDMRAAARARR